ncbi:MAG: hypothetical protein Q7T44_05495 [Parvibaculum sp.]|nr:hypothetical protein [Parvibaculum sp.]
MRNILLGISAATFGLMLAVAPAAALSTYEIDSGGGANFDGSPNEDAAPGGLTVTTKSGYNQSKYGLDNGASNQFAVEPMQQPELSKDMNWQGTGYYLRPER